MSPIIGTNLWFEKKKPEVPGVQRRGVKTVDLEGKPIPKFSRQRSQSFSGAATSNPTPNFRYAFSYLA